MKTVALALTAAALASAAPVAAAAPRLVGRPAVTYTVSSDRTLGRFVTIDARVRLSRPFPNATEQHRYALVAAPRLRPGQRLADELFGGSPLGRLAHRRGAYYQAEAVQLQRRRGVRRGARWQIALARGNRIVGTIKTVTLRRA